MDNKTTQSDVQSEKRLSPDLEQSQEDTFDIQQYAKDLFLNGTLAITKRNSTKLIDQSKKKKQ